MSDQWRTFIVFMLPYHVYVVVYFLDPEGGSQKATLVVLLLVIVISSLKIQQGFLNKQRSATKLFIHIRVHIPY